MCIQCPRRPEEEGIVSPGPGITDMWAQALKPWFSRRHAAINLLIAEPPLQIPCHVWYCKPDQKLMASRGRGAHHHYQDNNIPCPSVGGMYCKDIASPNVGHILQPQTGSQGTLCQQLPQTLPMLRPQSWSWGNCHTPVPGEMVPKLPCGAHFKVTEATAEAL